MTWPDSFPSATLQRVADAQAHLALEHSGNASIAEWQSQRLKELLRATAATHGAVPVPPHHGEVFSKRIVDHAFYADHQRQGRNPYAMHAHLVDDIALHEGPHITVAPSMEHGTGLQLLRSVQLFTPLEHLRWLQEVQPTYLTCTTHVLTDLLAARHMLEPLQAPPQPQQILRQILTYGTQASSELRSAARQHWGASLRHRYTCMECGPIAFQCPHSDDYFHVAVGNVLIEIMDDNDAPIPPTTDTVCVGRVLITALHHYATPMLRYVTGDRAALHAQCPGCGLALPTLSHLVHEPLDRFP